jgi:hypothetical protein
LTVSHQQTRPEGAFHPAEKWDDGAMNMKRIAAATAITAGLGLAGIGTASLAEAQPTAPLPDYPWCPG